MSHDLRQDAKDVLVPDRDATRRRVKGWIVACVSLLLVGGAIWWVLTMQRDVASRAVESLGNASPWAWALAIVLPLVNLTSVGLSFWVLTGRYGRVGVLEMQALVTSAWLLNMVPFRPGLIGRVGYHKAVNRIAIADSVKVLVQAIACNGVAMLLLVLVAAIGLRVGSVASVAIAWSVPLIVLLVVSWVLHAKGAGTPSRGLASQPWRWTLAVALRYVDLVAWAGRYLLAFYVLGVSITTLSAVVIALASEVAMLAPVQLGLREWVVGLTYAVLSPAAAQSQGELVAAGVLADMLNRGIDVIVALPLGILASLWVARRIAANRSGNQPV